MKNTDVSIYDETNMKVSPNKIKKKVSYEISKYPVMYTNSFDI